MDIKPQIFLSKVMHRRIFPKENLFTYGLYYLTLPLPSARVGGWFAGFYPRDLGYRDGSDPYYFARNILKKHDLDAQTAHIMLMTMPRVLGYIFNPVSFYFCFTQSKQLIAVISEVHNTFGEQHIYLCSVPGNRPISGKIWLETKKIFHVSPFLKRDGYYRFRFALNGAKVGIWINYYNTERKKQLITSLIGELSPMGKGALRRAFWRYPLLTWKAIALIHLQALKLIAKRVRLRRKPRQLDSRLARSYRVCQYNEYE